ncbi:MAG: hypothetical protein A2126_03925 [Candidatus Woykebacteria bacterium GWB1_45_5]|uniref:Uncharacterized protein n=1 Tax=Candidatus Woykebacteria bacterium GWB1_45_5 TaxID=1802592 RepID=A0A1G1W3N6_9BACT|nr:MAG: hypothetical protein A2126_03925 [Candidatus Woykebacteria bacterium GWB1_45_5]
MPEVGVNPQVNNQPAGVPASTTTKSRRSYVSILIGVLAVVIAALAIWIGYQALNAGPSPSTSPTSVINQTVPEVKSDADLQKLEEEVKNTDVDGLTKDLDQNDTDAAGF